MNFFIELERKQHLTVAVTADYVEDAIRKAKEAYANGMLPDREWADYEDKQAVAATDVTIYCHPFKDLTAYTSAVEFASKKGSQI